jgi:hypothetical protein
VAARGGLGAGERKREPVRGVMVAGKEGRQTGPKGGIPQDRADRESVASVGENIWGESRGRGTSGFEAGQSLSTAPL